MPDPSRLRAAHGGAICEAPRAASFRQRAATNLETSAVDDHWQGCGWVAFVCRPLLSHYFQQQAAACVMNFLRRVG